MSFASTRQKKLKYDCKINKKKLYKMFQNFVHIFDIVLFQNVYLHMIHIIIKTV